MASPPDTSPRPDEEAAGNPVVRDQPQEGTLLHLRIAALEREHRDLERLLDATGVAMVFIDNSLCAVRFTHSLTALFPLTTSDLARPLDQLGHPAGYEDFAEDVRRVIDTGGMIEREVETDDASYLARLLPYTPDEERPGGVVATFLDITRRRRAEESAAQREARFQRVIEEAPIPVFLHDEEGRILQISRTVTTLTGYTPEELPTRAAWIERAYGASNAHVQEAFDQLYTRGEPIDGREFHIRTKSGEERVWQFSAALLGDDQRGQRLAISMAADVTERKRAEAEREARARQQHAVATLGLEALSGVGLQALFERAVGDVQETLGTDATKVLELAPDGTHLSLRAGVGWPADLEQPVTVPNDARSQAGYTLNVEHPVIVTDASTETRFARPELLARCGLESGISVVIESPERPFGVLGTHARARRQYSEADADFLQAIANVLASAVQREAVQHQLQEANARLAAANETLEQRVEERTASLHESEARFRGLFEGSPDAIFVEDLEGVVLDVNPAACRLHRADREWLVGRAVEELVPPAHRDRVERDFARIAGGQTTPLESFSLARDGTVIPVEVRADRLTYGGREAVLLHVRDITARREAEQALKESEERFAKAFHAAPVAVLIATFSDGRFVDVNESFCRLTGYTRVESIGSTYTELDLIASAPGPALGLRSLREDGEIREVELQVRTRGGTVRDVVVSAERLNLGGVPCVLGIGFDVTERKRLEREVIQATELERRRIGQDLHDGLGQQLTGAAFLGKVLQNKLAARGLDEAADAGQLTDLITDALTETRDFSRLLSPVDIQAEGLVDALQELVDQTERVFEVSCLLDTEGDVRVADNAAATHLFRIAQEAVNNALKHASPSSIVVHLTRATNGLRLTVEDDGSGFDPQRLPSAPGLGLRTMQYRATLIDAQLSIERGVRGTRVVVRLPEEA